MWSITRQERTSPRELALLRAEQLSQGRIYIPPVIEFDSFIADKMSFILDAEAALRVGTKVMSAVRMRDSFLVTRGLRVTPKMWMREMRITRRRKPPEIRAREKRDQSTCG